MIHAEEENPDRKINAADGNIPPVPFAEAIDFLKARVPMTKKDWEKLEPKLRFRAFTVAKLGTAVEIETAKQILVSALEKGESYSQTWEIMNDIFGKGELGFKPGYWENVFRTNTQTAYMAGKLQQYEKIPGIVAYQLLVIEDVRTSKICRNLLTKAGRGLVLSVDDDFWKTKGFPPYHFQCRSSVRAVYQHQLKAENIKIDEPKHLDRFKPQTGFGGNPLDSGNWWDLTENQKKLAVKYGLLKEFEEERKILGISDKPIKHKTKQTAIKVDEQSATIFSAMSNEEYIEAVELSSKSITNKQAEQIMAHKAGVSEKGYVRTANSYSINESIRNNKTLADDDQKTVAALREAISKNILKKNTILIRNVYPKWITGQFGIKGNYGILDKQDIRGTVSKQIETDLIGKSFYENQFLSCSTDANKNLFKKHGVILEIHAPKGTHCYLPDNTEESECILDIGQKLNIIDVKVTTGKVHIVCKLITGGTE